MLERIRSYCGPFQVGDADFELLAERLIPRPEGVSFRFTGLDEYGGFVVEGLARTNGGMSVAGNVPVRYTHYAAGDDYATISFTSVEEMYGQTECHVLGLWTQGGGTSSFKAVLRPFNPSRPADVSLGNRPSPAYKATKRELKTIKARVAREVGRDVATRGSAVQLAKYAKKSKKGERKGNRSKAKGRDMFTKGTRLKGSAFSRK
jgi:hypothetical protein